MERGGSLDVKRLTRQITVQTKNSSTSYLSASPGTQTNNSQREMPWSIHSSRPKRHKLPQQTPARHRQEHQHHQERPQRYQHPQGQRHPKYSQTNPEQPPRANPLQGGNWRLAGGNRNIDSCKLIHSQPPRLQIIIPTTCLPKCRTENLPIHSKRVVTTSSPFGIR